MCSNLVRAVNAQRWDDQCLKEFLLNLILGTFLRFSHSSTGRSTVFWGLDEADDKSWTCSITRKQCSDQFQVKIPQKLLELGEKIDATIKNVSDVIPTFTEEVKTEGQSKPIMSVSEVISVAGFSTRHFLEWSHFQARGSLLTSVQFLCHEYEPIHVIQGSLI